MTRAELAAIVAKKVDEDTSATHRYITDAVISRAIDRAQGIFAFLTLCYEKTGSLTFTVNEPALEFLGALPDFIAPLRLSQNGQMLYQQSLAGFAARDNQWIGNPGQPLLYCLVAGNLLAICPPPVSSSVNSVSILYAAFPADGSISLIPEEDHESLAQGAASVIRQIVLGGQFGPGGKEDFQGFWMGIQRRADFIRNRSMTARYNTLPAGVTKEELKKLLEAVK